MKTAESEIGKNKSSGFKKWFKQLGVAGFLFFLIKGLIWLGIFFGLGKYLWD